MDFKKVLKTALRKYDAVALTDHLQTALQNYQENQLGSELALVCRALSQEKPIYLDLSFDRIFTDFNLANFFDQNFLQKNLSADWQKLSVLAGKLEKLTHKIANNDTAPTAAERQRLRKFLVEFQELFAKICSPDL